ncbi:hypothetical protein QYF61_023962, partial [Mycteria americana]
MDNKLNMSEQCTLATKRPTASWAVLVQGMIPPLYSTLIRLDLEFCVQFWAHQYKEDTDILNNKLLVYQRQIMHKVSIRIEFQT